MGLLKHFRSRSRLKDNSTPSTRAYTSSSAPPARGGRDFTGRLPAKVLDHIFTYVCPHTQDTSYEPSERSQIGDGCMLCDLRDLANCAQVCQKWHSVAQKQLYKSVRIDAVHYCALEEVLAERRRKHTKHSKNRSHLEAGEVPNVRLSLLCRTLRDKNALATQVLYLKLPYMTRETAKGELARTVSVLPNLRYCDLPDGFFTGDPSCVTLRQELQIRCPDFRKMTYRSGSEEALELLTQRYWQSIEVLELSSVAIEPATLRIILASLPRLYELMLSELPWMDDSIFQSAPGQLPDFPPLRSVNLERIPNVTASGLVSYLNAPQNREALSSLSIQETGITIPDLHFLLSAASSLQHISITDTVTKSLGLAVTQLPPLDSVSLRTMHFEITSSDETHALQNPAESYYLYLCNSINQNALPALEALYVRDQSFPELLLSTPAPSVGSGSHNSLRTGNSTFKQTLEVFSKGMDELEWVFTSIAPPSSPQHARMSTAFAGRPLSAYSASRGLGPQWAQGGFGGEARRSVMVGNGFGGFLAVPQDQVPRPITPDSPSGPGFKGLSPQISGGSQTSRLSFFKSPPSLATLADAPGGKRGSKHDLWR